jgi:hypothetical protein
LPVAMQAGYRPPVRCISIEAGVIRLDRYHPASIATPRLATISL